MDFLLMIIKLISLGITAESLRTNNNWQTLFSKEVKQFGPKFQIEGYVPHQSFFLSET